jgi:hypothetical protein
VKPIPTPPPEDFSVPFEVPYDVRYKEVSIHSWNAARIIIGNTMARDPASITLGYRNPFKARSSGTMPESLETADEWDRLLEHVRTYRDSKGQKPGERGD